MILILPSLYCTKDPAYLDDEIFHLLHDQLPKIPVSAEIDLCDDYNAGTGIIPHYNTDI